MSRIQFHGPQQAFFEAGPQPTLFLGGVGSGKTHVGILKLLYLLDMYPGSRGCIIRQRFSQLKKTTAATLRKLLPQGKVAGRNNNEGYIQLTNGSELLLMHLDKADSLDNLKSLELNFAYIDQVEDVSAEAWDTLQERLGRWTGALKRGGYPADWPHITEAGEYIPPPYLFASAYSPGYENWLTARFWEDGSEREKYREEGYTYLVGSTRENPNLTKGYVAGRLRMGAEYVERYVDATSWGANEGRIFDLDSSSIVEATVELMSRILNQMRIHRVLDPGDFSPTACLWYATDYDGNVFFYREYMKENLLVSQHRLNIYEMSKLDTPGDDAPPLYYSNVSDPVIDNKTRGRTALKGPQFSVQDEWNDKKIQDPRTAIYWRKALNDESMTITRLREHLRVDPLHRNPITGEMGAPRIYFLKRATNHKTGIHETLTDIRAARRIEVGVNSDGTKRYGDERDEDVRDHLLDCVRYAIGLRPSIPIKAERPVTKPGEVSWDMYAKYTDEVEERKEIEHSKNFPGHNAYGQ